jgi:hypothetical protein
MPTIALEVTRQDPAFAARRTYQLPVTVGRGTGCDIQLAADNRAISRLHLEIVEERGRLVSYNRASNLEATSFNGRGLTPNERVEIVPGDAFRIFETNITVLQPAKLGIMIARRSDLKPMAEHYLLPGAAILGVEVAGVLTVELIPDLAKLESIQMADKLAVLFYYDGDEPTLAVLSNPSGMPVLLDRAIVDQQAIYIHSEDTIEVGEHRYEVMTVGEASIVCENPGCQVLNAYDRGETCRICGTRLFGATRLLRVRKL